MGILDKLLGGVLPPPRTHTVNGTTPRRPSTSTTTGSRPANPMRQPTVKPKPTVTPPAAKKPPESAETATPSNMAESAQTDSLTADSILEELVGGNGQTATSPKNADKPVGSMGLFSAEREEAILAGEMPKEATEPTIQTVVPEPTATAPTEPEADEMSEVTRRKLNRYFAKLRTVYPDGVIVRLNTGHKKLAERGAQLRRELNMEGQLDAFFALGEFTYRRSEGGRPSTVDTEPKREQLKKQLSKAFPGGIPSVAAVERQNHTLYLQLRAAARKEQCTMTEFLQKIG